MTHTQLTSDSACLATRDQHRVGLRARVGVHPELDTSTYPTGVQIGDAELAALPLTRHAFRHTARVCPGPASWTIRATWTRLVTSSLARMLDTWALTVGTLM